MKKKQPKSSVQTYKELNKSIDDLIKTLPQELRPIAKLFYYRPQAGLLTPTSFDPTSVSEIIAADADYMVQSDTLEYQIWRDQVAAEKRNLPETATQLVITDSAAQKRRETLRVQLARDRLAILKLASQLGDLGGDLDAKINAQIASDSELLERHNSANRKKQQKHRLTHLDAHRIQDRSKIKAKRDKEKEAKKHAPFIAIDAEGCDFGERFPVHAKATAAYMDLGLPESAADKSELQAQDHRTFLWGACGQAGTPDWLGGSQAAPLSGEQICEWLIDVKKKNPFGIFVMFAAGYDWTQILRDLPYERAWEIWNGKSWDDKDSTAPGVPRHQRWAFGGNGSSFVFRLYPGKYLEIAKLRDRNAPRDAKGKWNFSCKIKIFDVFGFFQTTFIKAACGFGDDFLSPEERSVIEDGKSRRVDFRRSDPKEIMRYTQAELHVLARMMSKLRDGLRESGLELRNWHGAGCIAERMMKKAHIPDYYPENIIGDGVQIPETTQCVTHAFFGGRMELLKQGVHARPFCSYDISSAYPHVLRLLPNMCGGAWKFQSPSELLSEKAEDLFRELKDILSSYEDDEEIRMLEFDRGTDELKAIEACLAAMSLVSMVRVRFLFPDCHRSRVVGGQRITQCAELPFYPLPVRSEDGTIYFPRNGDGIYMVEEVRAMLRWAATIYSCARPNERPMIALLGAAEFIPLSKARPFKDIVEKTFSERAAIIEANEQLKRAWRAVGRQDTPYNVQEKVLKLGINSFYGKTAQAKGSKLVQAQDGQKRLAPPTLSNPFYAAATTAGTRAMLLDAAGHNPDGVIMFATDGICSTSEIPDLDCPAQKKLGTWEKALRQNGVFVKAGIYSHEPYSGETKKPNEKTRKRTTKMRGIRPANLPEHLTAEQWLIQSVPAVWAEDRDTLEFPYTAYKTVGAATASREAWTLAGHWINGLRVANVQEVSLKRDSRGVARSVKSDGHVVPGQRKRAQALIDTTAAENPNGWRLSARYSPEWLNEGLGKAVRAEEEQKTTTFKPGFGKDPDPHE